MSKTVLLIGGGGRMGAEFLSAWEANPIKDTTLIVPSKSELNLENHGNTRKYLRQLADETELTTVLHFAARTNTKTFTENDRWANITMTQNLVDALLEYTPDILFLILSTNMVFDGQSSRPYVESDIPGRVELLGDYPLSKYYSEEIVDGSGLRRVKVRIAHPVYSASSGKDDYFSRFIKKAGNPLSLFEDQIVSISSAQKTCRAIREIITSPEPEGVWHFSSLDHTSVYSVVSRLFAAAGYSTRDLSPSPLPDDLKVKFPPMAALDVHSSQSRLPDINFGTIDSVISDWLSN